MSAPHKIPAWSAPVSFVAFLLGFLLVSAFSTQQKSSGRINTQPSRYGFRSTSSDLISVIDDKEKEIAKLREENAKLLAAQVEGTKQSDIVSQSLREAKLLAGLTEVVGPGVEITLKDSEHAPQGDPQVIEPYLIHDDDIIKVINECWLSGAEAIAINNQRIVAGTSIHCEGPVVYVGRVPVSSPVVIRAIGDLKTMYGALNMNGRYLSKIRLTDPSMVELKEVPKMTLPAFSGSTQKQFAKPVEAQK